MGDLDGVAVDGEAGLRQEHEQLVGIGMPLLGTAQRLVEQGIVERRRHVHEQQPFARRVPEFRRF